MRNDDDMIDEIHERHGAESDLQDSNALLPGNEADPFLIWLDDVAVMYEDDEPS